MKTRKLFSVLSAMVVLASSANASPTYSVNIVGYVNVPIVAGGQLIANPLDYGPNSISVIMPNVPDGTMLTLWDSFTQQFLADSMFNVGSGWTIDYSLEVGMGALVTAPTGFTQTFVGSVLQGPDTTPADYDPPTPPALGPGLYLLSSLGPLPDRTFQDIVGRSPVEGEFVRRLIPGTDVYSETTFTGGSWNNDTPLLQIGQSAFFGLNRRTIVPTWVPEPGAFSFLLIGAAGVLARKRMR